MDDFDEDRAFSILLLDLQLPKHTSIVITNQRLSHMLRDFFKFVWKTSKAV